MIKKVNRKKNKEFPKRSYKTLVSGTLFVHARKGFGFVSPDHPEDFPFDIFIPPKDLRGAIDGDHVVVSLSPDVKDGNKRKGTIHQVISRGKSALVGTITRLHNENSAEAFIPTLGPGVFCAIKLNAKRAYQIGDRVLLKTPAWNNKHPENEENVPLKVIDFIGNIADAQADFSAIQAEYDIPETFPAAVLKETEAFSEADIARSLRTRTDLRNLLCFTIDSASAKDFDDAVSLTSDNNDNYILGVHIADVSHYVTPRSALDKEAAIRCNSTYFPGRVVPMLPPALSDNLCSLKPNVDRLAVSVFMTFTKSGLLSDYQILRSVIKSKYRLTYDEVDAIVEGKQQHPISDTIMEMAELSKKFSLIREERGCIRLTLPSFTMTLDDREEPTGLIETRQTLAHKLIEEFMLKANEVIAYHISHQGVSLPFRIHESPNEESLLLFQETARDMGFDIIRTPSQEPDYQYLLQESSAGHPLEAILHSHFVRSMKTASYSTDNKGHYGLKLDYYTHFTSPIRRYVDLVVHRLLFHPMSIDQTHLEHIVRACSNQERVSAKAESSFENLKKLRFLYKFLEEQPEKIYQSYIITASPDGISFVIPEFCQEGFISMSQLPSSYSWKKTYADKGLPSKMRPGTVLPIQLVSVDFIAQEVMWGIAKQTKKKTLTAKKKQPSQKESSKKKPKKKHKQ